MPRWKQRTGRPFPTAPWDALVECIDAVFKSWNNERAVTYRRQNDIRGLLGTAVNVQSMFPSEISGILFTQDPNDLAAEQMIIEASYGLGEAVVSGDVTPDRFVVERGDASSFETVIGRKTGMVAALGDSGGRDPNAVSLTPDQVQELCGIGLKVEEYFGRPMDIEWGWADGAFALLQSRPIRGLDVAADVEEGRLEEIERLRSMTDGGKRVWVAHNLGETLRAPTPLTWDIISHFMSGSGGFGLLYKDLGYKLSKEVCERGFLDLICGRIYADPDRVAQLFWEGVPMTYDLDEVLRDKNLLDGAPTKFEADKVDGRTLLRLPGMVWSMIRSSRITRKARSAARDTFQNRALPPYLEYVREEKARDLASLGTVLRTIRVNRRARRHDGAPVAG